MCVYVCVCMCMYVCVCVCMCVYVCVCMYVYVLLVLTHSYILNIAHFRQCNQNNLEFGHFIAYWVISCPDMKTDTDIR